MARCSLRSRTETPGKAAKEGAASIPDQQVTSEVVPGFQPAPANLSDLFGSDDGARTALPVLLPETTAGRR